MSYLEYFFQKLEPWEMQFSNNLNLRKYSINDIPNKFILLTFSIQLMHQEQRDQICEFSLIFKLKLSSENNNYY